MAPDPTPGSCFRWSDDERMELLRAIDREIAAMLRLREELVLRSTWDPLERGVYVDFLNGKECWVGDPPGADMTRVREILVNKSVWMGILTADDRKQWNLLARAAGRVGIIWLEQLACLTEAEVVAIRGVGVKAIPTIRTVLEAHGLALRETREAA